MLDFVTKYQGKLVPICARPGMGATSLLIGMVKKYLAQSEKTVLLFSPRLSEAELLQRIGAESPIDAGALIINDASDIDLSRIREAALAAPTLGLIALDALDAVAAETPIKDLQALAASLGVPILTTASVLKSLEDREDKRPVRDDIKIQALRENSPLFFLYREHYYSAFTDENAAELIIDDGTERKSIPLIWLGSQMKFHR